MTYFHSALLPAIVHPEESAVVSLPPEFITPQDGTDKQDCETNAAKRWIASHQHFFAGQPITLLGDDLYSRQPMVEHCAKYGFNYIFVCLPQSHLTFNWSYTTNDFLPVNDPLGYLLDGAFTQLTDNFGNSCQSGTANFAVTQGQIFGFRAGSIDGSLPSATTTITNFDAPTGTAVPLESDALPIVASAAFMAGGLWWKKKRSQAKVSKFMAQK